MRVSNNYLQNFTTVSKPSEVLSSFRGPLHSYHIVKSVDREKGLLRRWTVFSEGKRSTLTKYLFGKLLWDELNIAEKSVFWHLREITSDTTIYLSLKALVFGVSKKLLRKRLESGSFLGFNFITRQQYLSIKGRVHFFLIEETVNLRKVPKFSGYTKHYKDKGSLAPEREDYLSESFEPLSDVSEEIMLRYLTVGEISLFGGLVVLPDEDQKVRNGNESNSSQNTKRQKTSPK